LEIKTVQLVARLLCIHYVFIDNEGSALGVCGNALSNLPVLKLATSVLMHKGAVDVLERKTVPDGPVLSKEVEELLWSYVVACRDVSRFEAIDQQ